MKLFVESNFVLQIALRQEGFEFCLKLLELAKQDRVELVLPAYSISEPFDTLGRRAMNRKELKARLDQDLSLLARTGHYQEQVTRLREVTLFLALAAEQEGESLQETLELVLRSCRTLPVTLDVLKEARGIAHRFDLEIPDAIICASILLDLVANSGMRTCFVTTNKKDFSDPDLLAEFAIHDCKVLYDFEAALHYVERP